MKCEGICNLPSLEVVGIQKPDEWSCLINYLVIPDAHPYQRRQ